MDNIDMPDEEFLYQALQDTAGIASNSRGVRPARPLINVFESTSDFEFVKLFRLTKVLVRELIVLLTPFMRVQVYDNSIDCTTKVKGNEYTY